MKARPIAMKCNQEQFESIKPKLENAELRNSVESSFEEYPYLTSPLDGKNNFSNHDKTTMNTNKREIHETWNERMFLEACGIEFKETYKITKEQILKYNMKDEFPSVFKEELQKGFWYKSLENKNQLIFIIDFLDVQHIRGYGFDTRGNWTKDDCRSSFGLPSDGSFRKATPQEIQQALEKEWKLLGGGVGVYFKSPINEIPCIDKGIYTYRDNKLFSNGTAVFNEGKFASIIQQYTIKEAEEKLNCKIV